MFLPRPIFIANSNDETYCKRPYCIANVGCWRIFFFQAKPLSSGCFTAIVVLFSVGLGVGCFNFLKALEKKI